NRRSAARRIVGQLPAARKDRIAPAVAQNDAGGDGAIGGYGMRFVGEHSRNRNHRRLLFQDHFGLFASASALLHLTPIISFLAAGWGSAGAMFCARPKK